MTLQRKSFWSRSQNIVKLLWGTVCVLAVILTIVYLSKYTREASYLRGWKNKTNDYIALVSSDSNMTISELLNAMKPNIPNSTQETKNYTVEKDDAGGFAYVPNIQSLFGGGKEESIKCKPLPPKDDFSKCGNRVAERKCCEYIWAWKYKEDLMNNVSCGGDDNFGVIGGMEAERGQFPHMAAVGFLRKNTTNEYGYMCGGTLISEQFVLTAGHCTSLPTNPIYHKLPKVVAMGGEDISKEMETKVIDKIIPHPKYASPKYDYDIALFKLLYPVEFTYYIHPACLSTVLNPYARYTYVNITGWGTTNPHDTEHMTNELQVATIKLISRAKCGPLLKKVITTKRYTALRHHMLCAGDLTGAIDSCRGDSGGPLQVRINTPYGNIHRVVGVTSFGTLTCAKQVPGVYTSVSSVITWIEKNVWPNYKDGLSYRNKL